jgi:hypothetical protein
MRFPVPPSAHPTRPWLRHVWLFGPVALCTVTCLMLALHALPLVGAARLVFAIAVAVNVWLLALASWSSILGTASEMLRRKAV